MFRIYKSYIFMTLMCLWTYALIFFTLACDSSMYSLFCTLWGITAEDWAVAVFCTDTALLMVFSESGAFFHLLGSWLLNLCIPGGCGSWIVLIVYVQLFSFSFLVFYISCRLPVLLSSIMKLWISAMLTEVESCNSVSNTTWHQIFSICALMPCCKMLSSVWALLMLGMSWALL